jgi:hypothetical protein
MLHILLISIIIFYVELDTLNISYIKIRIIAMFVR